MSQASLRDAPNASKDGTDLEPAPAHVLRTRRSQITSYKESVLSGTTRRRSSTQGGQRTISGETLVDSSSAKELLEGGIKSLDLNWSIRGSDFGIATKQINCAEKKTRLRRMSTRLEALAKAKDGIKSTMSVLGKRGRDAMRGEAKATIDAAKRVQRRSSLRPRAEGVQTKDGVETLKKVKLSGLKSLSVETPDVIPSKTPQRRPKTKRWLSHGLYLGQDRQLDHRLKKGRDKQKAISMTKADPKENKTLPLPMLAGKWLLEIGRDFKLPYDVFSPLPPGQPKPEEWKKTQKNVFVGDAASCWKSLNLQEVSRCICTPDSGCDEDCQNRFMFYECDDSNCNIGAELCTNRSFEDLRRRCKLGGKFNIGVEVIKTLDRGYGVRSNRQFEPHQIIVEYAGEIITQEECDHRMNTRYKKNDCYYLMHFDQNMIIDATRGSIARFVNHSCEPNCKMVKWTVAGKPRMALFAGDKGIMTGDELTYDYNFDPFSVKNVQECRCGSTTCRGFLGPRPKEPKPKEPKPMLTNVLNQAKRVKRKFQEIMVGDQSTTEKSTKKRKIAKAKSIEDLVITVKRPAPTMQVTTAFRDSARMKETMIPPMRKPNLGKEPGKRILNGMRKGMRLARIKSPSSSASKQDASSKTRKVMQTASATIGRGVARSLRRSTRTSLTTGLGFSHSESTVRVVEESSES